MPNGARAIWYWLNSRMMLVTRSASRALMMREGLVGAVAGEETASVCEAFCIGVLGVHRRIEPAVGDHPVFQRGEQLNAVSVGKLEVIGEAAEIVLHLDFVEVDREIFLDFAGSGHHVGDDV